MDFAESLLLWYRDNCRDLPWRKTSDPYRIWISEIILQQTRVAQGLDYYLRFTERFPDVAALASAPEDEVLRLWQGLGYYSRARNLLAAARSMNGVFPETYEGVRALKGVGDYTAAAICSIAYGMPYAVVDGNVYRVLARYFGIETSVDTSAGRKYFASLADKLLDRRHPDRYNQAIMDFGAMVCTPKAPECGKCPLSGNCVAHASHMETSLPVKGKNVKVSVRYLTYLKIISGDSTFIRKRTGNDIWKGLYEFPLIETPGPVSGVAELVALPDFKRIAGAPERVRLLRGGIKHVLSHRVIYADLYEVVLGEGALLPGYLCVPEDTLSLYAFPVLHRKLTE